MIKKLFENYKYPIFAGISSISLLVSTFSLISISRSTKELATTIEPVSIWAERQNECITKTFRINGKNTQGIPSKVWSCNGGGD